MRRNSPHTPNKAYTTSLRDRPVPDAAILHLLRLWRLKNNQCRPDVAPQGGTTVNSDLFGLTSNRSGWHCQTTVTRKCAPVAMLLNLWLSSRRPNDIVGAEWTWSSITINGGYACKRHRDSNSVGPSIIRAFGTAVRGNLIYCTKKTIERDQ